MTTAQATFVCLPLWILKPQPQAGGLLITCDAAANGVVSRAVPMFRTRELAAEYIQKKLPEHGKALTPSPMRTPAEVRFFLDFFETHEIESVVIDPHVTEDQPGHPTSDSSWALHEFWDACKSSQSV